MTSGKYNIDEINEYDRNNTEMVTINNSRDYRYMEVLVTCTRGGVTGIFNTTGLNIGANPKDSASPELMAKYSDEQVMQDYNAPKAFMSGIRHWLMDKFSVAMAKTVRNLAGLDTRWGAEFVIPEGMKFDAGAAHAYHYNDVKCARTWFYEKGKPVFILDDPNGMPFVMQSYNQFLDKDLNYADLPKLGEKLKLPPGWKFRTRVLDQDLALNGIGANQDEWYVIMDSLLNTYSGCMVKGSEKTATFQP